MGEKREGIKMCKLPVIKTVMEYKIQFREYSQQYCNTMCGIRWVLDLSRRSLHKL